MSDLARGRDVGNPSRRPLTVGIVGAGRVGAVLGAALIRAGHRVVAASGVSDTAKSRIAELLPGAANLPADEVARLATDLLIIAVPDDALADVIAGLAQTGALHPGQVVAHTSGAHGLAVLAPATAGAPPSADAARPSAEAPPSAGAAQRFAGAGRNRPSARAVRPLALHPAMTFTGHAADVDRLAGASFGVTAPDDLRPFAAGLVADLGGEVEWIAEADRPLYHAALVHGANHLVTLVNEAMDRLRDAGVAHPDKVLAPLLRAALENTLRLGDAALTGPVSRGDAGTVAQHLDRLAATAPDSVPAYLALARRTADRAIASGQLRPTDAEPLLGVLATQGEAVPSAAPRSEAVHSRAVPVAASPASPASANSSTSPASPANAVSSTSPSTSPAGAPGTAESARTTTEVAR